MLNPQPDAVDSVGRWYRMPSGGQSLKCHPLPYAPGDRLWVREAWLTSGRNAEGGHELWDYAEGAPAEQPAFVRKKSSIHMPRAFSRLTLHVTDVRVQRLQDISEEDARAEGAPVWWRSLPEDQRKPTTTATGMFMDLWRSLHGADAWDANPWVAAISFTVEHANIDSTSEPA